MRQDPELYARVFRPPDDLSPRYIMRPGPEADQAHEFELLTLGVTAEEDFGVLRALDVLCGMGIGRERDPFRIVKSESPGDDGAWLPQRPHELPPPAPLSFWPLADKPPTTPCRLEFLSPLRLVRTAEGRKQPNLSPTLPDIVNALARRLVALFGAHFDELAPHLALAAGELRAGPFRGEPCSVVRYSASQRRELQLDAVMGGIELPSGPGPLWPLFACARWVHVGKATNIGLGQMEVRPIG
jgi:hypothetical protein